jgi:hypothetical protein
MMEGRYPRAVMVTLSDCADQAREAELNRWYAERFVPQVQESPLVQAVRRYESAYRREQTFRAHPRYLTIAEVEHKDVQEAARRLRELYTEVREGHDALELRRLDTLYQRIGPEFRSERSGRPIRFVYCGLVGCTDSAREDEWNRWYNEKHSPDALVGAFDTGYRYTVVDPTEPVPHQAQRYLSVYETGHDLDRLQQALADFRQEMIATDPLWVHLLAVYYSGLFTPMET